MDTRMEKLEKKINNRKKYGTLFSVLKKCVVYILVFTIGFGCGAWFKSGKSIYDLLPDRGNKTKEAPIKEETR